MTKKTRAELLEENSYLLEENSSLKQRLNLITSTYNQHVKLCSSASRTTPPPDLCHDENAPALNKPLAGGRGSTNSTIPAQHTIPVDHRDIHIQHTVLTNEASPKPSTLSNEASIPHTTPTDPNDQVPTTKKRKQWEIEAGTLAEKFKKPRHEPSSLEPRPSYDATITEIILGISWDIQGLSMDPNLDPISSMEKYAWITKNSRGRAKHTSSVASFQDLIFHSACAVLEHCGVSAESIDMVMRITTSESQPKNLKRLRSGAVWVNEVISKLTEGEWTGLSDCIAELLFHNNVKMSTYGIQADSKNNSIPYMVGCLSGIRFKNTLPPWCIPAFVRLVLPAEISVEEICEALKYKKTTAPTVNKVVSTYQDAISRVCKLIEGSKEAPRPKGLLELPPPGPAEESAPAGNDPTPSAERGVVANSSGNGSADVQEYRNLVGLDGSGEFSPNGVPTPTERTSAVSLPDQPRDSTSNESIVFVGDCPGHQQLIQEMNGRIFMGRDGMDIDELIRDGLLPKPTKPVNLSSVEMLSYDEALPPLFNITSSENPPFSFDDP